MVHPLLGAGLPAPAATAAAAPAGQAHGGFAAPSARRLLAAFALDGTFTTTEYSAAFPNPGNAFYASDAVVVANPTWFSFPRTCSGGRGCGNTNSPNVS